MTSRALPRLARAHVAALVAACGRRRVVGLFTLQLLAAATEALGLALLVPAIQAIGGTDRVGVLVVGEVAPQVSYLALGGVVLARAGLQWWAALAGNEARVRTSDHLRLGAMRALFAARWSFVTSRRRSHVVQSLTTEAMRTMGATDLLIQGSVSALILVATATVAVALSPVVGATACLCVLFGAVLVRSSIARSARLGDEAGFQIDAFGSAVSDSLTAARLIIAHDAHERWHTLAEQEAARTRGLMHDYVRTTAGVRALLGVLAVVATVGLVLLGKAQGLGSAELIALAVLVIRLLSSAQGLVSHVQHFANLAPALDKLTELTALARLEREVSSDSGGPAVRGAPSVQLRHVVVRYAQGRSPALDGVSLAVAPSRLTVISGPSGSGKSTLVDVVLGLLRPESGEVWMDHAPLTDLTGWRARLGYVPQEPVLVPGTVWDNLVWSVQPGRKVDESDAWRALAVAELDEAIGRLPNGLHTWLAETAELSGGEKQRLTIARALMRDPDLLVLDEATSALDTDTERRIVSHLKESGRTILFVTHRNSIRAAADVVVELAWGRVVSGNGEGGSEFSNPWQNTRK